jgi:hypothetical protein
VRSIDFWLLVGVIRAWRVVKLPARGHVFNVSAAVLPVRAGVANHEQMGLFDEAGGFDQLVEFARLQLERERLRLERERLRLERRHPRSTRGARRSPRPKHLSSIVEWRTWQGFRDDLQAIERDWRRNNSGEPAKSAIATSKGCIVKTITRTMADYRLRADQWPPSTWPAEPPPAAEGTL